MSYAPPATTLDPTNVMGRRIGAWFIDALIPTIIALIIGWGVFTGAATKFSGVPSDYCVRVRVEQPGQACFQVGNDAYVGSSSDARHAFAVGFLVYLVGAVNLFVIQGLTGAAIGKHMFGLRVIRGDGRLVGFGWNALRTLLLVVDQFFCALPGIITASVTHPHRRVGDFAAGTYVVSKESVGTPIGNASGTSGYPPPWTPPGPTSWGLPPAGGGQPTWGAPAPAPGWGTPAASPPASTAPPPWGTPAASPPPAETPSSWGAPAPTDPGATTPAATETPAPAPGGDAPGWGAPAPAATASAPPEEAQTQAPPAASAARDPQWDAQRNAWVYWEAETNRWLQHDPASGTWGPLR